MHKLIVILIFVLTGISFSYGQGTVRGKITDESGETVIGATVVLKSNKSIGAVADLDGNYSLKITDTTSQTIVISFISYKTIEETIHPVNNEVIVRNFTLTSSAKEIKEVTVTGKAVRAKEYFMENMKKKSATTLDYISSETMKKTGDANVTAAVTRVAGVSTNGSFITIRGIGDRYIKTGINGSRIPTLDPFTNNIRLDMFPAALVDNVLITKTASPDLPGDWAGAYLSVETKDYPEKLAVNFETSIGYNNMTTFKDEVTSQHSSTDWLGYDNNLREHSHDPADFHSPVIAPTLYQQLVANGLGNYYSSMGVTSNTPWNDTYYKLGLIQLGLLAPADINNDAAFANAKTLYNAGPYQSIAFHSLNGGAVKTGQSFPDTWNTQIRKAPLDFSNTLSIGDQLNIFGKQIGFLLGYRYGSSDLYDPAAIADRPYPKLPDEAIRIQSAKIQQSDNETHGWSALANLSCKLNANNSVSLLFMPNITGTNKVRNGYDEKTSSTTISQFYEQRRQLVYQFKSEHYLPSTKLKIESNASYTRAKSSAPDFRNLGFSGPATGLNTVLDPTNQPTDRYYRYLNDNLFDSRLSAEFPIGNKAGLTRKIKFGGAYQRDDQTFDQYHYYIRAGNGTPAGQGIDELLSLENFGITSDAIPWYYVDDELPVNHTFGNSTVTGGFLMADYAFSPKLRFSGGLRAEQATIYTDVDEYDSLGYAPNDIRRYYKPGYPDANPGKLNEFDYLPSANFIYALRNDEQSPVNVRLNYSRTLARPSIRELSNITTFDYELQGPVTGNPDLKTVHIDNYDVRFETWFRNKDNISVSVFYKHFKDDIELEQSDSYYWQNVDQSHVTGIEIEGRKGLIRNLEIRANVTLVNSNTTFVRTRQETVGGSTTIYYEDTVNRSMFGQAPYVINAILSYNSDSLGLGVTVSYNIQGPRLVIGSNVSSLPDIYEQPRNLLDLKITKTFAKHFGASITARNILNAPIERIYHGWDVIYDKYTYGTIYTLGVFYKL